MRGKLGDQIEERDRPVLLGGGLVTSLERVEVRELRWKLSSGSQMSVSLVRSFEGKARARTSRRCSFGGVPMLDPSEYSPESEDEVSMEVEEREREMMRLARCSWMSRSTTDQAGRRCETSRLAPSREATAR